MNLVKILSMVLWGALVSLNWAEIPTRESKLLWLGTYSGQIQALEEKIHFAHTKGEILLLKEEGDQLESHEAWALLNQERLLLREKNLLLSNKGVDLALQEMEDKMEDDQEALDKRMKDIDEEALRLNKLKENEGAEEFLEEIETALAKIIDEKKKLEEKFQTKYSPDKIAYERDQLNLKRQTQQDEYENVRDDAHLKAGVSGKISYLINKNRYILGSSERAELEAGDPIAIVRNDDTVLIYVPEANFDAVLKSQLRYIARVTSESGMRFTAYYHDEYTRIEEGKALTFYRFEISKGDLPVAKKTVGESCIMNVLQEYETPVTIIEKEDLLRQDPEFIKVNGWELAVIKRYPDMKLAGVGKGQIAIEPKDKE